MDMKFVLCGVGGQGVVVLNRLLARAAIAEEHPVFAQETHGMSRRGGMVVHHLRIGLHGSPLSGKGKADLLLGLDGEETLRNLVCLRPGGTVIVNMKNDFPADVAIQLERLETKTRTIDASEIACKMGNSASANVVLAGFAAADPKFPLEYESLRETVAEMSPRNKEFNIRALDAGFNEVKHATV